MSAKVLAVPITREPRTAGSAENVTAPLGGLIDATSNEGVCATAAIADKSINKTTRFIISPGEALLSV
jgi:hypothetical protein